MSRHRHYRRPHGPPWRISRRLRLATTWIGLLLWLSGSGWMLLHYFFQRPGDFGMTPHPWEPGLIRVHGLVAVAGVFLFGWLGARHVADAWRQPRQRNSGIALLTILIMLVISGYALYYLSDEGQRHGVGIVHEVIGALSLVFAIIHWQRPRANRALEAERNQRHRG